MVYLSATFKQAIRDGIVIYGEFTYTGRYGNAETTGWQTVHYAVADNDMNAIADGFKVAEGYPVTHLASGLAAASFRAYHVALNFMLELERTWGAADLEKTDLQDYQEWFSRRGLHECQTMRLTKRAS